MEYVIVIGNGESRKGFDLYQLESLGTSIGTNAVHRDFHPDHLVCCDRRMVQEAVNNAYENPVYTRSNWYKEYSFWRNVRCLPELPYKDTKRQDDPWHWGSGGHALNLACTFDPKFIVMLGFDLYANSNNLFNNIYKSTENYNHESKPPTDPSYWIYQFHKLMGYSDPDTRWIVVNHDRWVMPEDWKKHSNVFQETYDGMAKFINKQLTKSK